MSFPLSLRSSPNPGNTLPPLSPLPITRRSSLSSPSSLYFPHPFLQEGLSILTSISTIMSHIPTSILNLLGLSKSTTPSSPPNMISKMRELVMDQQRTMFYTVTMSPTQQKTQDIKRTITPSLKWQCASSLSKSHMVLNRTNLNSPEYYTLTYMGEEDSQENFITRKMEKKLSLA
eukprot:TRINITY_DN7879_c0_g1_i5.p1 TRINITY_DN7879_c0_g1~~TRINITY_DN7879_c0_g1_i5.p1  ORF type:complete len:175 (+),score=63.94 TRINITY_DN7879_c0_g1_i5:202-726(+)